MTNRSHPLTPAPATADEAAGVDAEWTLDELCRVCAVSPDWVAERVEAELIAVQGGDATAWRFSVTTLRRARRLRQVERDFGAAPELAALVVDLRHEIERLRARLRRAGLE